MSDELEQLTAAQLSAVFAVEVAEGAVLAFAESADAVLPWLEKEGIYWQANGDMDAEGGRTTYVEVRTWYGEAYSQERTFARAACTALIRAKRTEREEKARAKHF